KILVHPTPLKESVYKVPGVEETGQTTVTEAPKELAPIGPLLAGASVEAGEEVFKKCVACHSIGKGAASKIGPNLWGVVNAKHGHMEGYAYSKEMAASEGKWDYESLNKFLYNPRRLFPGTKMTFAGLPKEQDRANVIVYMRKQADAPAPLP
ncbi:MAG: cytochrome c family protein, partial [Dongiaceae bacterium]